MKSNFPLLCWFFFHGVSSFDLPTSNDELKCIHYFLNNLTNFSRQNHFILLFTNASKLSRLEHAFLESQIVNRSISVKIIDQKWRSFDGKSSYIIFIAERDVEHLTRLLNGAKGTLHIILEKNYFDSEDHFKRYIIQAVNQTIDGMTADQFFHLRFGKKWKLYKIVRNQNVSSSDIFTIGECILSEPEERKLRKQFAPGQIIRVKSPNSTPFATFSEINGFGGIDYNLLKLIAEKLQTNIQFDYLNEIAYDDVLQQIIHGNLSESFLM